MPRIKRTKRPARPPPPSDDSDDDDSDDSPDELATTTPAANDDSDDDDSPDELAQLRAKEGQRRARRRAANARYRARHPERVAAQRQSYRARHPERVAAQKRRYRAKHPEREATRRQRYRARHPERVAAQRRRQYWNKKRKGIPLTNEDDNDDEDDEMATLQTSQPRYRTRYAVRIADQKRRDDEKHRAERLAYYRRYYQTRREWIRRYQTQYHKSEPGRAERQRTAEKRQALGPLSLTVSVDDFMQGSWDSLSPAQEGSVDLVSPRTSARGPTERERTVEKVQALGPLSLTVRVEDLMQGFCDSLSPAQEAMTTIMDMDSGALHPLDSSCDMWDEGRGFLDNLLQELSDLPAPSDDSLYGLLRYLGPWSPQESDFDLEDFLS